MTAAPGPTGGNAAGPIGDLLEGIEVAIFDKDGTLIDFRLMWRDWLRALGDRIAVELDGRRLDAELHEALGVDLETGRVLPHGALAATPMTRLRDLVETLLLDASVPPAEAARAVGVAWHAPDPVALAHPLADLRTLFGRLGSRGIRVAVATSDDREPTARTLRHLGLTGFVAALVCADDGLPVKPHPAAMLRICAELDVAPGRVAVIGDAPADLAMGRSAGAGCLVGVLTGVGDVTTLGPLADVVLASVADLAGGS